MYWPELSVPELTGTVVGGAVTEAPNSVTPVSRVGFVVGGTDGNVDSSGLVPFVMTISGRSIGPDNFERVEAVCEGLFEDATTLDRGWVENGVVTEAAAPSGVIDRDTTSRLEE